MGVTVIQRSVDDGQDSFGFLHHLIVPETQNSELLLFKPCISLRIVFRLFGMSAAIHLNDQPSL